MTLTPNQKILFFDTETSGLPDFKKRASDPSQPHIVQLAAILTDWQGAVLESHNVIVKPEGWEIPKEVSDIHGITPEIALDAGIIEPLAISLIWGMILKTNLLVAHNLTFDKFMLRIAARRFGLLKDEQGEWWTNLPHFCTMHNTTALCNIPGKIVGGAPKWPKLQEAYQHIFGQPFEDAHDAMADVTAIKDIFFFLNKPAIS